MFTESEATASLANISQAIVLSWNIDTCWPNCWNPENPSGGHCRVTAALIQESQGGEILFARVGNGTHYWNLLPDGKEYDLTRDQFPEGTVIPEGVIKTRHETMDSKVMTSTYPVLQARVSTYLKG